MRKWDNLQGAVFFFRCATLFQSCFSCVWVGREEAAFDRKPLVCMQFTSFLDLLRTCSRYLTRLVAVYFLVCMHQNMLAAMSSPSLKNDKTSGDFMDDISISFYVGMYNLFSHLTCKRIWFAVLKLKAIYAQLYITNKKHHVCVIMHPCMLQA